MQTLHQHLKDQAKGDARHQDFNQFEGSHDHILGDVYHNCETDKFFRYSEESDDFMELLDISEVLQLVHDLAELNKGGE